jgi:hypothetical protein
MVALFTPVDFPPSLLMPLFPEKSGGKTISSERKS